MRRLREHHVRLRVGFLFREPAWVAGSDAEQALFVKLSGLAIEELREFLPAGYTPEHLGRLFRRKKSLLTKTLDAMLARDDALVGRLSDGRLRVIGVRLWQPGLPWRDESDELRRYQEEHPDQAGRRADEAFAAPGPARPKARPEARPKASPSPKPSPRAETSADPGAPREDPTPTAAPPTAAPPPPRPRADEGTPAAAGSPAFARAQEIIAAWPLDGFRDGRTMQRKLLALSRADPVTALGHTLDVNGLADGAVRSSRRAALLHRLNGAAYPPGDAALARAKELLAEISPAIPVLPLRGVGQAAPARDRAERTA